MTINRTFQNDTGVGSTNEQDIVEDNVIEMIQISGYECYYIPKSMFAQDYLFHETPAEKFESSYALEMYMSNVTDFGGQGDFASKFGLEIDDTAEFSVSRKRFKEETSMDRPLEGDLVYFPLTKHLFEIEFVEDEPGEASALNQFYSLGRLYTYTFKCRLFAPSYEDFDTSIDEIDNTLDPDTYEPNYGVNDELNDEADDNLDWSEDNPFGRTTN